MDQIIDIFNIFFKLGIFTYGGGYVMLPLIYHDVNRLNLMSADEFANLVALSQVTPGPIAINSATYVGFLTSGFLGAVLATFAICLPSFFIVLVVSHFMNRFKESLIIKDIISGIRPATVGLLVSTVIFFSENSIVNKEAIHPMDMVNLFDIPSLVIFALTIFLSVRFKFGPIGLTLMAGVMGVLIF